MGLLHSHETMRPKNAKPSRARNFQKSICHASFNNLDQNRPEILQDLHFSQPDIPETLPKNPNNFLFYFQTQPNMTSRWTETQLQNHYVFQLSRQAPRCSCLNTRIFSLFHLARDYSRLVQNSCFCPFYAFSLGRTKLSLNIFVL